MPFPTPPRTPRRYTAPRTPRTPLRGSRGGGVVSRVARRLMSSPTATRYAFNVARLNPYAMRAFSAARMGYSLYKMMSGKKNSQPKSTQKNIAGWAGKFNSKSKSKFSPAQKYGVVISQEQYEPILSDPNLVGIGVQSVSLGMLPQAIACAIIRKLLKKAINFDATDLTQEIPVTDYNNAVGGKISFTFKNSANNTLFHVVHTFSNDDTIYTTSNTFVTALEQMLTQGAVVDSGGNTFDIWERVMYVVDPGGAERTLGDINMLNEVLKLHCKANLKVQNRTAGATNTTTDAGKSTDRSDVQPVQGFLVYFNGGTIKYKSQHSTPSTVAFTSTGTLEYLGNSLHSHEREPKRRADFINAYSDSFVRLEPGQIKYVKCNSVHNHYVNNFFDKFRPFHKNHFARVPGKAVLLNVEETMNTGSANPILLGYEVQRYCEVYFVTGKKPICTVYHTEIAS